MKRTKSTKSTVKSTVRVGKKVYNAEERPSIAPWVLRMRNDVKNKVILEKTATGVRAETKETD